MNIAENAVRIVVCIKQVPDTTEVRIDPERGTLVRRGVPGILNPLDAHAVEAAVALAGRHGGSVTALSMGPPQAEQALREAIALGADRGVLLTDRAFSGADTWATSYTLACAVRALGGAVRALGGAVRARDEVDLALCGKQAIDGDTAQVGPGLAAQLGWPQATYVRAIQGVADGALTVERLTDYGTETLRVRLPAVLTALKDLNVPRLPSLVSRMRARRCAIERWGADCLDAEPASLGLDGSPTRVVRVFTPPRRGECVLWQGEPEDSAARLAEALKEENFV